MNPQVLDFIKWACPLIIGGGCLWLLMAGVKDYFDSGEGDK